ncbi:MAG: transposase [Acidaminococcales bacterium]|nr:transposase [Acidaminococcales bacterium]
MANIHFNCVLPKKRFKLRPLSKADKLRNHDISSRRVLSEHVIGFVKRFRIVAEHYRNRRKRFPLRFSLICGLCNFDRAV